MTGEGGTPPCPKSLFYELMDFTFELSKLYNVIPFDILRQDKDEVIMLLNYMAEKSETAQDTAPAVIESDRKESAAFWAAL